MAQSGFTPIKLYLSTTPAAVPTAGNLEPGELALNNADGKLFYEDSAGVVQVIATKAGASGTVTSVDVSGGTTGLTTSGGPVTGSGTITLAGTLAAANGGTGLTSPGTSGNILTSNGSAWTSSAPAPGGIDYVVKTANYTTQNNEGVLADTSGGAFTVTLPATPAAGDQCIVADAGSNFGTNNLTVGRNGSTIGGLAENLVIDITGVSVQFVYDGTTWEVYAQIGGNGGTAVTLAGVQTLTNKTISGSSNTLTNISLATAVTGTLPAANGGTGITSPGTSGNILTSNGTAWTSAAPAPSAGTLQAIATGSLSDGSTVIINSDGTVSKVLGAVSAVVFESATTSNTSAIYDSTNGKVVIAYTDEGNTNYGTAIVGTVSAGTISFGTAVVFESATTGNISAVYDSTNSKVVIAYRDQGNSSYGTAIVGTVSGTSISFGSAATFSSTFTINISATYDSTNQKVVIGYGDGNLAGSPGYAVVGTVSGTSISFGSPVGTGADSGSSLSATYDTTNNRVVIAYVNTANSSYGTARVGTVSGTSISFGTAVVFESASTSNISAVYDPTNNRVVLAYTDSGNSSYGTAIVGTVSGTSISFGTAVVFESASSSNIKTTYNSTNSKVVIAYTDSGNSGYGTAIVGTVSGTSISFSTPVVFQNSSINNMSATYDSTNDEVVISYKDLGNSSFGTARVVDPIVGLTNLTTENYIGISNAAYTNGQTATIQIVGSVDDAQSGLTAGQFYYVQLDGTLSQTPASTSVFAGTAVSATKLIIKG